MTATGTRHVAAIVGATLAATGMVGASAAPHALALLGQVQIPALEPDGVVQELSGIGWDADAGLIYAVSDRGMLYHLRVTVADGRLIAAEAVASYGLADENGAPLAVANAEDLAVLNGANGVAGDTELLIVLEDGPSAARFSPQGMRLAAVDLPPILRDKAAYASKNRGLESIAVDPGHGLITAPESPLAGQPEALHRLYAADGTTWDFPAAQAGESRLKAIAMLDDGDLLVMERLKVAKGKQEARLRRVSLGACPPGGICAVEELAIDGQPALPGNYEGMTALPDGRILMVTDQPAKDGTPTVLSLIGPAPPR